VLCTVDAVWRVTVLPDSVMMQKSKLECCMMHAFCIKLMFENTTFVI
jgi:hypothetical protein